MLFPFIRGVGGTVFLNQSVMLAFRYGLVTAATVYAVRQVKKPTRFVGRFVAWMMNSSHSALTDWARTHIQVSNDATVLDVGCGGGRTIEKLAKTAAVGIRSSTMPLEALLHRACTTNNSSRKARVIVEQASVSRLPFGDNLLIS